MLECGLPEDVAQRLQYRERSNRVILTWQALPTKVMRMQACKKHTKRAHAVLLDETPIHLLQAFLQLRLSPLRKQLLQ